VEIVEMTDDVPDDVLEEAMPRGSKCCLKNQKDFISKNWKNLRVNKKQ
jgi:hypothetical protein